MTGSRLGQVMILNKGGSKTMSREIENVTAAFRKARKEGEQMMNEGRLCWEDFVFIMVGYEEQLKTLGANL